MFCAAQCLFSPTNVATNAVNRPNPTTPAAMSDDLEAVESGDWVGAGVGDSDGDGVGARPGKMAHV